MTYVIAALQVLVILVSPLLYAALGTWVYTRLGRMRLFNGRDNQDRLELPLAVVVGLLFHLVLLFFLKCLGMWWIAACLLPFILPLTEPKRVLTLIGRVEIEPSLNFLVWFFVVICLGVSLFQAVDGIQTPWVNNYGDLTFHLGMISSFVFGENFPPQYHIFAGERLSYPFFINLWSAALWWPVPGYRMLSFIFTFQWTLLWCLVYWFLRGNRFWLAPWALLLGGGCYGVWESYSWELLGKGCPWTVFLTTIWVTQRAALLGMTVLLCALHLCWPACEGQGAKQARSRLALGGALLGLAPLSHTHSWLVALLFIGIMLSGRAVIALIGKHGTGCGKAGLVNLGIFAAALIPALFFLPWLIGKGGVVELIYGWSEPYARELGAWPNLAKSAKMWAENAPAWFLILGLYWLVSSRHLAAAAVVALFVLGNFVKLAYWDWDQLKIFIALYAVSLFLWTREKGVLVFRLHHFLVLLTVPALVECYKLFDKGEMHTVYNQEAVQKAQNIADRLPRGAIFAAAQDHNSLITLTGRRLYCGYDGTLSSHGIDYAARQKRLRDLQWLCRCERGQQEGKVQICPDFLLWTDAERKYWKSERPPGCTSGSGVPFVYKLPGGK